MPSGGSDPDAARPTWAHRPHLDGLRTLAVYLVVAFHAGLGRVGGGFVGVDVFFVLSGYLVTGVLLRDLDDAGSIRLARFYARRVRRLLPAASVTLVLTLVAFSTVADPISVDLARSAARAAFSYVTNWFLIRRSVDYFAEDATNPFVHYWSLAVEEQFYLLWPLALTGLFAIARRLPGPSRRWVQGAVAAGGLVSVGAALALRVSDLDRAYYGTDTRAYQLLLGATLALAPGVLARATRRPAWYAAAALGGLVGLAVVSGSWWATGPITRGVAAALLTAVLIIGLEAAPAGPVARLFAAPPLVRLGQISYGTYLWHWPVIVILAQVRPSSPSATFAWAALLGTALAALSHQFLEWPIRTWALLDRRPRPVALLGLAVAVVGVGLLVPALSRVDSTRTPSTGGAALSEGSTRWLTPIPAELDVDGLFYAGRRETPRCVGLPAEACTVRRGSGPHVLLMGDSVAVTLLPALETMAERHDLTLSVGALPGCPWQEGIYKLGEDVRASCRAVKEDLYARVLPALAPDLVVALNAAPVDNPSVFPDTPASREERAAMERSVDRLADMGASVAVLEPLPRTTRDFDLRFCLGNTAYVESCRFQAELEPSWVELEVRRLAEDRPWLWSVDIDRIACPMLPICDPIVDGVAVWQDGLHLTEEYATSRADDLYGALVAAGALRR